MDDAIDITAVEQVVDTFHAQRHAPGVQLGVVVDGKVVHFEGRGVTDCETGASAAEQRVFRIASMSKTFTAAAILQLRDQNMLRLDDPIRRHLPFAEGVRGPATDSPAISVRDCLTMSSGLPTDDAWADREESMTQEAFDDLVARPLNTIWAPGTRFVYSNLGYAILGRVVEAITEMSFVEYATTRLLEPLGMTSTTYDYRSVSPARLAKGYRRSRSGQWVVQPFTAPGSFSAIGGVLSTIHDMARWVHWLAEASPVRDDDDTSVLSRAARREMQLGHRLLPDTHLDEEPDEYRGLVCGPFAYGFGVLVDGHPGEDVISHHRGGYPGFGSYMTWHQSSGLAVVAFANGTYAPVHVPARAALDAMLGQRRPHRTRNPAASTAVNMLEVVERTISDPLTFHDPVFATNVLLDIPLAERTEAIADARKQAGERTGEAGVDLLSPTEATFRLPTLKGRLDVTVALTPTMPPRIQTFGIVAVPAQPMAGPG